MKKLLASLVLLLLSVSTYGYTPEEVTSLSAQLLSQRGIITTQTTDAGYRFGDKITRAETIGIALKLKGLTPPDDYICQKYFKDTTKQDWVCRAIELASTHAMISRENKTARPQDSITRAEAFAILYKASNLTPTSEDTVVSSDKDIVTWQTSLLTKMVNTGLYLPGAEVKSSNLFYFYPNRLATRSDIFGFAAALIVKKEELPEEVGTENKATPATTHTISVIDGDTIKYDGVTIRMIGLDSPESNITRYGYTECYGSEATEHLKGLLQGAKELTIVKDPTQGEFDKYDRTLGYVFLGDSNINGKMIADGYAFEYTYSTKYKYQSEYKSNEKTANDADLGMWSVSTCNGDRKKGTKDEVKTTKTSTPTVTIPVYTPTVIPTSNSSYTCGAKKYCKDMSTCEEAKYYLNVCGLNRLDGDSDGTPCETICG